MLHSLLLPFLMDIFRSYGSLHWIPISTLCGFCDVDYNFIGKFETFEADLSVLEETWPRLTTVRTVLDARHNDGGGGNNATKKSTKKQKKSLARRYFSQLSEEQIQGLAAAYSSDFMLFGYPYPKEFLE